jgi:hypothetical protein
LPSLIGIFNSGEDNRRCRLFVNGYSFGLMLETEQPGFL